jgi:hypothetical protein
MSTKHVPRPSAAEAVVAEAAVIAEDVAGVAAVVVVVAAAIAGKNKNPGKI